MSIGPNAGLMQCHYCDAEAAVAVEKDALKVGLCRTHLRERLHELADNDALAGLQDELDIDRS
jgi:hypothetical protein